MRLLRFGNRVVNMSALLEAWFNPENGKCYLYLAGADHADPGPYHVTLEGHEVEAFRIWLQDNSDLVTSFSPAAPADIAPEPDHGHDSSIPF